MSTFYRLARTMLAVADKIPLSTRHALSSGISSVTYLGWRSKRLVTQQNMSKVLGLPVSDPRVKRAAFASWSKYGRTASDLFCFPLMNVDDVNARTQDMTQGASWEGYARQALEPGKGVIVASAHFGSWDTAGAIVARHFPVSAIAETFKDPQFNELIQGSRREKNVEIIPVENSARRILQDLHQNKVVAIVVDRPSTKEKGVEVTFFGYKTYVPGGPAALALKAGAAVMPGFLWYGSNHRFYMRAFPPIFPRPCRAPEERAHEITRLTQYMYDALEEVIGEWPTQWFMFRPFWPADATRAARADAEVSKTEATVTEARVQE